MKVLPDGGGERRRLAWLVGLLVVLVALLLWSRQPPAAPGRATSNAQAPVPDAGVLARPAPVDLAALEDVPEPPEPTRNPFAFGVRPPPPPPPPPPRIDVGAIPTAPPPPQGPPPIALRMVGAVKMPDGRTMITLKDPKTNILFQAFEGDVVDGRYRVTKVTMQSAMLSYVDGSGARTVRLGG
jgi:hypothetical protein